ncbi:Histone deacetylase complex subunit SAP30/SAP30-like [Macleaya cordata]|uniref:Histone deacetylase complex subunit SAP30/SAP30-like n=1 Tax=Macleaya cordata TaxID=56857 RepID=A0A200QU34_MACCD|nr:Histone deacetylase complex subunit SAP30/SAP30-like [Macleaya cordata]
MEGTVYIKKMLEAELCSSRVLSPFREESGDEELSVLPRHTKVIVTGNNRTKSVLVGLQGVVKKAVGLGGWHWLVLKNGVEVKLQRNALSVLEPPTGNEEDDDDHDFGNSCSSSDMGEKDNDFSSGIEFHKPSKPRIRHTRPWLSSLKPTSRMNYRDVSQSNIHKTQPRVNLAKLGTNSLWRYLKHYNLVPANPNPSKDQIVDAVQRHFLSQKVDENEVIMSFIHAAKRLAFERE